jgi:hypothetical protein
VLRSCRSATGISTTVHSFGTFSARYADLHGAPDLVRLHTDWAGAYNASWDAWGCPSIFGSSPVLASAPLVDVPDHGLTTFLDFNSLNANDLRSAAPQPA